MLAHVASAEGIVAAENIMGNESKMDYGVIPSCIFTSPEIASVGINPAQAKERNIDTIVGRFNFLGSSKAQAMGETEGFIQLVVDKNSDKILGGQIMGAHATDLIHEIALAVKAGITAEEIGSTVHAHPTLSEAIRECAENVHGRAIHLIKMG
jgi:dihydrolipoamide dehydrogenase